MSFELINQGYTQYQDPDHEEILPRFPNESDSRNFIELSSARVPNNVKNPTALRYLSSISKNLIELQRISMNDNQMIKELSIGVKKLDTVVEALRPKTKHFKSIKPKSNAAVQSHQPKTNNNSSSSTSVNNRFATERGKKAVQGLIPSNSTANANAKLQTPAHNNVPNNSEYSIANTVQTESGGGGMNGEVSKNLKQEFSRVKDSSQSSRTHSTSAYSRINKTKENNTNTKNNQNQNPHSNHSNNSHANINNSHNNNTSTHPQNNTTSPHPQNSNTNSILQRARAQTNTIQQQYQPSINPQRANTEVDYFSVQALQEAAPQDIVPSFNDLPQTDGPEFNPYNKVNLTEAGISPLQNQGGGLSTFSPLDASDVNVPEAFGGKNLNTEEGTGAFIHQTPSNKDTVDQQENQPPNSYTQQQQQQPQIPSAYKSLEDKLNNLINERKAISKNNYGNTKTDGASFYKRAGGPSIVNYH